MPSAPATLGAGEPAAPAKRRSGWTLHLALYLLAGSLLIVLKLALSGNIGWAIFPLLGWGAGLLLHYWLSKRATGRKARLAGR